MLSKHQQPKFVYQSHGKDEEAILKGSVHLIPKISRRTGAWCVTSSARSTWRSLFHRFDVERFPDVVWRFAQRLLWRCMANDSDTFWQNGRVRNAKDETQQTESIRQGDATLFPTTLRSTSSWRRALTSSLIQVSRSMTHSSASAWWLCFSVWEKKRLRLKSFPSVFQTLLVDTDLG